MGRTGMPSKTTHPIYWPTIVALAFLALVGCSSNGGVGPVSPPTGSGPDTAKVALTDLGSGTYRGFAGGLYPNSSATVPSAQAAEGMARTAKIRPLDANGIAKASGRIVLVSIGMSNTSQEFCTQDGTTGCYPETFMGRAASDGSVDHSTLVIVNGAQGGRDAIDWASPAAATYNVVRDRLTQLGVTEKQVQVAWLLQADAQPSASLPSPTADAYVLESRLGSIVRSLHTRYPNLQEVFLGTRNYGGFATSALNPEPYAYEGGFAVKWLIESQINQMQGGSADSKAGDLNWTSAAPWLAWGPYSWAPGNKPRSDGLVWLAGDFGPDGTHPSESWRSKAGSMLLSFFKTSQFTKCWFLASGSC